jgi:hypothetical protein
MTVPFAALNTTEESRRSSSAIAVMISAFEPKYRYRAPAEMPAAAQISCIELWWKPRRLKQSSAASKIWRRRRSASSGLARRDIEDWVNLEMLCCGANKANVRSLIVNGMHLSQRLDARRPKVLLEFNK